ncbi:hypothetical protein DLJ53_17925 [Acuticoccus sediminis]|uniref:Uncharacterized protein n=1 Tax=Acuticoccus sediminis TaxID=2184697 RepID=A0A8B2NUW8_9HYPH|nr:hypothetical protein DLJ53_17925 [Acuticoccus sediminis]
MLRQTVKLTEVSTIAVTEIVTDQETGAKTREIRIFTDDNQDEEAFVIVLDAIDPEGDGIEITVPSGTRF